MEKRWRELAGERTLWYARRLQKEMREGLSKYLRPVGSARYLRRNAGKEKTMVSSSSVRKTGLGEKKENEPNAEKWRKRERKRKVLLLQIRPFHNPVSVRGRSKSR